MGSSWIAVRTKPRLERTACSWITDGGFEAFLPLAACSRRKNPFPLFPGYLFVQIVHHWRTLLGMRGVLDVVRVTDGVPGRLPEQEIMRLRALGTIDLDVPRFNSGDRVRVVRGFCEGAQVTFDCYRNRDRVRVLHALLGRMVPVELEESALELV